MTAALVAVNLKVLGYAPAKELDKHVQAFRHLLNEYQLFEARFVFDREYFELEKMFATTTLKNQPSNRDGIYS
jgi:hypothetical protein